MLCGSSCRNDADEIVTRERSTSHLTGLPAWWGKGCTPCSRQARMMECRINYSQSYVCCVNGDLCDRQRSTGGSTPFGDRTEKSGSTALPPDKARSDVRERDGPARGPSFDISDDATKCKREIRCWPEYERTRACDFVPKKKMEESGELKTVERVVAVLLEENIRLGSTERKLQVDPALERRKNGFRLLAAIREKYPSHRRQI